MALPLAIPLAVPVAAALGFGGGFLASEGLDKLVKTGLLVGAGYLIYKQVAK